MSETPDTKSFRIDYRHLAFFFLGAVCVCAVFFSLGFVVGRAQAFETALKNQEDLKSSSSNPVSLPPASSSLRAVAGNEEALAGTERARKSEDTNREAPAPDYRKDLDFYSAVKEPKVDQNFHPESPKPGKPISSERKAKPEPEPSASARSGRNGKRLVSLQVAALKGSAEADRMAKMLRSKGYPVFIVNPAKEDPSKLIRVQIGPYSSEAEAAKVKARLSTEGYAAISKH